MPVDVVLCSAPVTSVLRPSVGLGTLQAAVEAKGYTVETLYLNMIFANRVGVDVNEAIVEETPAHLLVGDWIFAECVCEPPEGIHTERHRRQMNALLARRGIGNVEEMRRTVAAPVVDAATELILERRPRIVGFSTTFQQTMASLAIAAAVKRADPDVTVVFGGANCHGPMGGALLRNYPQIDHVFNGEADFSFPQFVDALLRGGDASAVPGQLGRAGSGAEPEPVFNLDAVPIPEYGDYFRQLPGLEGNARVQSSIPFESSRGCWWGQKHHCTFCGLNAEGMTFRSKSADRVLEEIAELERRHGVRRFAATDNILSLRHIEEVLPRLAAARAAGADRILFYEIKANLDERQLAMLADAGIVDVQPGIESLSDEVLAIMRKGVDSFLNLRLMRNCREFGMSVAWSILHGFPGEPAEAYAAMAELLPSIEHLQPPIGLAKVRVDRFSPNFTQSAEMGFGNVRPMPVFPALHRMSAADLADLAYFFEGEAAGAATDAEMAPLRAAVDGWRALWDAEAPPQLHFVRIGAGLLVKDTRRIALTELTYLEPAAAAVADRLRNPARLETLFEGLAGEWPRAALVAAVRQLTDNCFLYVKDDKALSLLVEADRARCSSGGEIASGRLLAPSATPALSEFAG